MTEGSDNKNIYKNILSLDGGGIRGIITARILQEIEDLTGKRIHELFDLIVGTSAGGILATGLAGQHPEKNLPYKAEKMVGFYRNKGPDIFYRRKFFLVDPWWWRPKYRPKPLESVLEELLGDAELINTKPDIIATSYDIEARKPYLFKTSKARKEPKNHDHLLRDVARATSAAPSYFKPLLLNGNNRRALIDGGVFANNPSMIALSEALSSRAKMESSCAKMKDILLCAVGTGTNNRELPYKKAKDWGLLEWAQDGRMISVMMDSMSDSADHHARRLLPDSGSGDKQRYFRFDIELTDASDDLDDASPENIKDLLAKANQIITNQGAELKQLVKALTGPGTGGQGTSTGS